MKSDIVNARDKVKPKPGMFMPYWSIGAFIVEVGTPKAYESETPKIPGGDWVIISSYGGWLPRSKFEKL
jgi:hypothetical protein